ncbi:RarD protein [Saprolegnia parasitica CBS 223.65]|uniref:RarD protein n=1 Tax=Saprolegnia parasitica (strain CBS 223.65) TaxID=695850 RepID=A0A067BXZ4_SAPPC|nr:RarD protein [Saprolegnia parasitica CBS 223.65]KDO21685.1 RarD protein [Saprolegnia parasitica CBS 223.65]|eukprot:XP_012207607.1 RarD protein [Saprolegnia parasitica CBS 223.65]
MSTTTGVLQLTAAFTIWGFIPIYWKQLESTPALQLVCHRLVWSCLVLVLWLLCFGHRKAFLRAIASRRVLGTYLLSSLFVTGNWLICIWAMNTGYIVEASLGAFINPLIYVAFGVVLFRERLSAWQWAAMGLATTGLGVIAVAYGKFPWIALTVALTFALYGLVKKTAPLSSFYGLAVETLLLSPLALVYLIVVDAKGMNPAFDHGSAGTHVLLVGAGVFTIIPLLFFSSGAKTVPMTLLGVLQYITPSLQFLVGTCIYHEELSMAKLAGFILVWMALLVYTLENRCCRSLPPADTGDSKDETSFHSV